MTERVTRLVLVRHGEAICNVSGVVGGPKGCTGLTPLGRAQAARLAERLAHTGELDPVDVLYASVLPRAVETAGILSPVLIGPRGEAPPVTTDCALCELHPGEADGLGWDEFLAGSDMPDWDTDPTTPIARGGESWSTFVDRAAAALESLVSRHEGQTVVAVTHAGVVEASMVRFLPLSPSVARLGLRAAHASLTVWEHDVRATRDQARGRGGWRLERFNDTAGL